MAEDVTLPQSDWLPPDDVYQTACQRLRAPTPTLQAPPDLYQTALRYFPAQNLSKSQGSWTQRQSTIAIFDV